MPDQIPFQIDKDHFKETAPIRGSRLYELGKVGDGYDLWQEGREKDDDTIVPRGNTTVEVRPGDKFYSAQSSLNPGGLWI
jgi:hypothetical protein